MKLTITVLQLIILSLITNGQNFADGYYIKKTGDTVVAKIKIRKRMLGGDRLGAIYYKIEVLDSISGKQTTLTPQEIVEFEFNYYGAKRHYCSKTVTGEKDHFFERIANGTNLNCFEFAAIRNRMSIAIYILETKSKSVYIKIPSRLNSVKPQIESLFDDNPEIQNLINNYKLSSRHFKDSLTSLVVDINKL